MMQYNCKIQTGWDYPISKKAADIMRIFGLTVDKIKQNYESRCPAFDIDIKQGDIVFITGASGGGKSLLLKYLYNNCDANKIQLDKIDLPSENFAIDNINANNTSTIEALSKAGLGDVFIMLNPPAVFSDGEKYRYRLAKAVSDENNAIFADEFCSNLDRITASAVALKIAKHIRQTGKTLIAASAIDDIIPELSPDITIICRPNRNPNIIYK